MGPTLGSGTNTLRSALCWSQIFFYVNSAILSFCFEQSANYMFNFLAFNYLLMSRKELFKLKLKIKVWGGSGRDITFKPCQNSLFFKGPTDIKNN